ATRCGHEENPYFHGWLISSHPEMSPPDYSMALSYSPETQSINSAFAELRECIPNVPADTKLSKIKTLRLATSYIAYLMDLLAKDDQNGEAEAFKAEIKKTDVKEEKRKKEL
ncbi:HAND2 protein, partial [Leptocoma aspasia]|nr:HAND2 protein [Leptocoma aspasia]